MNFPTLLVFSCILVLALGTPIEQNSQKTQLRLQAEARVNKINREQSKWTAKMNPRFAEMSQEGIRRMLGVRMDIPVYKEHAKMMNLEGWLTKMGENVTTGPFVNNFRGAPPPIPDHFDAREQWPECADVLGDIQDQSSCGSCWAVSAASVMQDRLCIASGGKIKVKMSAQDVLSCSHPWTGCQGGLGEFAFLYWHTQGVSTGGKFNERPSEKDGCKPYPFPPHDRTMFPTPRCEPECENPEFTNKRYNQDRHYGLKPVNFRKAREEHIKLAIMKGGSVQASFMVYSDFMSYHSGVYEHTANANQEGGHAVRLIGWGEEKDRNDSPVPYWLAVNSWNTDWGEKGYFKIIRGKDECNIESWGINFADPDLEAENMSK